jgi:hypothetical protein
MTLLEAIKEKIRIDSFRRQNTMPVFNADKLNKRLNELKTMEDKFTWTDELVREFALGCKVNGAKDWVHTQIEQFKASKLPSKEYEILSFYDGCKNGYKDNQCIRRGVSLFTDDFIIKNNYTIHSVKRLSDGEVFSVGSDVEDGKILGFHLYNENLVVNIQYFGGDRFISGKTVGINDVQHAKETALFITEDGKPIFKGETFYEVNLTDFFVLAESALHQPPYDKYYKYFSTKEKADEYVLLNKPCLSLNDLLSVWDEQASVDLYRKSPLFKNFKELAKSKINQK